jgi:hypothetical protein
MLGLSYPKWLNFLLFQAIWFAAIMGREELEWLVAALLVAHILLVTDPVKELRVILPCAAIGIAADAVLTLSGVFVFDPAPPVLPIPFWLIGIWLAFAGTFRHSMSYLLAKPVIAIPAAAIAAPLSYVAGMGLGAVSFGLDTMSTAIVIGLVWPCMMAVFIRLHRAQAAMPSPSTAVLI